MLLLNNRLKQDRDFKRIFKFGESFYSRNLQLKLAKKAEELGFYFSIPAICVRLQHFQEIIRRTNINNLLTETDAPYLTPEIGRSSEPKDVLETIRIISKIKNLDLEETKKIIFKNYQDLFLK